MCWIQFITLIGISHITRNYSSFPIQNVERTTKSKFTIWNYITLVMLLDSYCDMKDTYQFFNSIFEKWYTDYIINISQWIRSLYSHSSRSFRSILGKDKHRVAKEISQKNVCLCMTFLFKHLNDLYRYNIYAINVLNALMKNCFSRWDLIIAFTTHYILH